MEFKIGDKVTLLNEVGEGMIMAIVNPNLLEVEIDGFAYQVPTNEVILSKPMTIDRTEIKDVNPVVKAKQIPERKPKRSHYEEIDLHLHNLVSYESNLSNSEKLFIQLEALRDKLEKCIKNKTKSLIVVHGIGKGVLKAEVRKVLSDYHLEYFDASYRDYGRGATQVNFY
ncbi:MAG: Smr/MutS family protein [Flavobacteriales bacterium]|nr:Smr/MutS family protein [Flavobacteriales bacterium]